ncbi:polysaccharide biosynthesis protein [Candidatus Izimaplasma bacterium]|nr:polysaccharide biosynthesis protein [Candidatus Izimaplasma bacterium]
MKNYKNFVVLGADVLIVLVAFFLALIVKNEFQFVLVDFKNALFETPFVLVSYLVVFEVTGMYKSLWKYASIEELLRGVFANFLAINIAYIVQMLFGIHDFNYELYFVAFFLIASGTIGMRMSYRFFKFYKNYIQDLSEKTRTLIVGAGQAGVLLLEEVQKNKDFDKNVIGFIDDNDELVGKSIRNIPVLGTTRDICQIAFEKEIDTIIVAVPSLNSDKMKELLNRVEATGAKIKMMPPFYEMIGSKKEMFKVRDIKIEDLLGRDPIVLEETGIREFINNKAVMVTGGGGSIGSELVRQLRHYNPSKIIIIDIYENNAYDLQQEMCMLYKYGDIKHQPEIIVLIGSVRDESRMEHIFRQYKPEVIFHAAAHKHVPLMEVSPMEAIKNNVIGTYNVASLADKYSVEKFVLVSTDKAVRPTNVMGATKRIAEKVIMAINVKSETEFAAVRFGNVLGSNGSVIPLFKKQIESGGPVTVTHPEITRFFMTIPEACQLVIQAGAYANGGELFVLDMGEPVKIIDLAEKMIRLSGREPFKEIGIEFTGLRPGEKMYEELLKDSDSIIKTSNEKIYIEKNNNGYKYILDSVNNLKQSKFEINPIDFIVSNVRSYNIDK